jgi:hypothetical protein
MELPFIIGATIVVIIILVGTFSAYNSYKVKKAVEDKLTTIANSIKGKVTSDHKEHKRSYDFKLENDDTIYFVKIVNANKNNELVLTNQHRWYLNYIKDATKSSKNKRVLSEMAAFTYFEFNSIKKVVKVALIYPGAKQILKYINESEVIFVTPKTDCWGYRLINFDRLDEDFRLLRL